MVCRFNIEYVNKLNIKSLNPQLNFCVFIKEVHFSSDYLKRCDINRGDVIPSLGE